MQKQPQQLCSGYLSYRYLKQKMMETQLEKEKKFKNQNVNHINKKMDDKLNCTYLTPKQMKIYIVSCS